MAEACFVKYDDFCREKNLSSRQSKLLLDFLSCKTPSNSKDLVNDLLEEKIRFKKTCLAQTLGLIEEREKVKQHNIASIDSQIMELQAELYFYVCHRYPVNPESSQKKALERMINELRDHRRDEETGCWKDTFKLWQELLLVVSDYRAALRKADILFGDT